VKQLTAPDLTSGLIEISSAPTLSPVTRFRDPELPYEDLIQCERDCMRCSYAATLDCDGNCGSCPRQSYCPCVNPAKVRMKNVRLDTELPPLGSMLGHN
jgi:hypothetical protein